MKPVAQQEIREVTLQLLKETFEALRRREPRIPE